MSDGRTCIPVEVGPDGPHDGFVDYLLRLGCTVVDRGGGRFDVCVSYPETVDDEAAALAEWCASWSRAHRSPCTVGPAQGSVVQAS